MADRMKGVTGENLLSLLERRLDNVVYRLGFATSRTESRQLVRHGHFTINGRKVNIPSIQMKSGDVIELREKSRKIVSVNDSLEAVVRRGIPQWLELQRDAFKGISERCSCSRGYYHSNSGTTDRGTLFQVILDFADSLN